MFLAWYTDVWTRDQSWSCFYLCSPEQGLNCRAVLRQCFFKAQAPMFFQSLTSQAFSHQQLQSQSGRHHLPSLLYLASDLGPDLVCFLLVIVWISRLRSSGFGSGINFLFIQFVLPRNQCFQKLNRLAVFDLTLQVNKPNFDNCPAISAN